MSRRSRLLALAAVGAVALPFVTQAEAQAPAGAAEISVLSGRADLVSGGDALVAISLGSIRTAKITLISGNRVRDVGRVFTTVRPGELRGLLTGSAGSPSRTPRATSCTAVSRWAQPP